MINKDTLRELVLQQKKGLLFPETVTRELVSSIRPWLHDDRILILTGIRRCGKSTLLRQIMRKTTDWCYCNFEDERLLEFKAQDFEQLNEVLTEAYGSCKNYFFDEIQNVDKFETFVRRLQDQGKKVILTGSNASLLSKEFGTRLTGRYKSFEVYPFSFREFMHFKKAIFTSKDCYDIDKKVEIIKLFKEYLALGGLPEYLKNKDKDYVQTVFENIMYRDIITRYSIRREKTIKMLVNLLATNATLPFTYNSVKKVLELSNAITVKEYISYLSNSYLFFELLRFSYSLKKQLGSPRKIYLIDLAFNRVCGLNFTPNLGRALENTVFIELKRFFRDIYYYSNENECDFIVKDGAKIIMAVQVCHALTDSNRKRELDGLIEAMDESNLKEGLLLTYEQTEDIIINKKKIKIIPVYRWLLESGMGSNRSAP